MYAANPRSPKFSQVSQPNFPRIRNPRIAHTRNRAKTTTRRKSSEWSALENLLRATDSAACRKIRFLELAKGFEPLTL
jgi:hypothetical protein